jgi:(p)ppGpp synthase/HD superfamily hydrolase
MKEEVLLGKAIAIAAEAFKETLDKGGHPYILHCLRIMNGVEGYTRKTIAILHDVLEDCKEWTPKRLYEEGFSDTIVNAVVRLTHDKSKQSYDDYIKVISLDEDCTEVKKKDLEDNSNITRLKGIGKKDFDRMEKYHKAFLYLNRIEFKPVEA